MFANLNGEVNRLERGEFSTPVQISDLQVDGVKGMDKMEKPIFIHKKEQITNGQIPLNKSVPILNDIKRVAELDAKTIKENLLKLKNASKRQRLNGCKNYNFKFILKNIK